MNPYASYLDGRPVLDIIRATPAALQSLTAGLDAAAMDTPPAPGKWSVRGILAHLADCELVFGFRLRQALEKPGSVITPFDQDAWATRYSAYSAADALRTFLAMREWNVALLAAVSEAEYANTVTHPERGEMTFQVLVETIAGHDLNHLNRLRAQLA
jgi:hypothetical protein